MKLPRLSVTELYLVQLIFWLIIWLSGEYLAALLTSSIGLVVLAVLLIALISEWIEPSKVPKRYFAVMIGSLLAIVSAAGIYYLLFSETFNPFGR